MDDYEKWRRFKKMTRSLAAQIEKLHPDLLDFTRASGQCECEICGLEYFDHPQLENGLFVVCSGRLFHL